MQYSNHYDNDYDHQHHDSDDRDDYAAYMRDPAWHEQAQGTSRGRGRSSRNAGNNRIKNVSTIFLNECRKQKLRVRIRVEGDRLYDGTIDAFDQQGLILASENSQVLIYYSHMVSVQAVDETPYLTG